MSIQNLLESILNDNNQYAQKEFNNSVASINNTVNESLKQAYLQRENAVRNINQQLVAQGFSGGANESTLLGIENEYLNNRNKLELARQNYIADFNLELEKQRMNNYNNFNEELLKFLSANNVNINAKTNTKIPTVEEEKEEVYPKVVLNNETYIKPLANGAYRIISKF